MKFKSLSLRLLIALVIAVPTLAMAEETTTTHATKSLWEKIVQGGWVMFPLAACSIAMVWLISDGILRTRNLKLVPPMELEKLRNAFRAGDYVGAYQVTQEVPCAINNVVRAGLVGLGDGKDATEEAMLAEISKEQARGSVRLSYLSVIGVCTPMIGLIGTVTGMISAFEALGEGNVSQNADKLAAAIGEVLVATATGLFVAVPAFMAYYFLRNRLQNAMQEVEYEGFNLFRKMPYHLAEGVHIGDQELYANAPNWVENPEAAAGAPVG